MMNQITQIHEETQNSKHDFLRFIKNVLTEQEQIKSEIFEIKKYLKAIAKERSPRSITFTSKHNDTKRIRPKSLNLKFNDNQSAEDKRNTLQSQETVTLPHFASRRSQLIASM